MKLPPGYAVLWSGQYEAIAHVRTRLASIIPFTLFVVFVYLDLAYEKAPLEGRLRTLTDLQATIMEGAAKRLRPKLMTMATMFVGLIPIMWATGTGSDVWKRIAADGWRHFHLVRPRAFHPAIYEIWKWHFEMKRARAEAQPAALVALQSPEAAR